MTRSEDFYLPRQSFLPVIEELKLAQRLIDEAGTAIVNGDLTHARQLLSEADIPEIGNYVQSIAGSDNDDIHRCRDVPGEPPFVFERIKQRMPSRKLANEIFERDGWHCRFCNIRIISKQAIKRLQDLFPDLVRWTASTQVEKHPTLRAMCSSLDHVIPHSRGGDNDPVNLIATCGSCQFGRNSSTIKEVGLLDPRDREPIRNGWDGLLRIVNATRP